MRTNIFFAKSGENLYCPHCAARLKHRDWKRRVRKKEGGFKDFIQVERLKCPRCQRLHTALPDFLAPYKHYETEVISGVLDGVVTEDDLDDESYPRADTMRRWKRWLMVNRLLIDGRLKSDAYGKLGFSEALLLSDASLLDKLRAFCQDWLEIILRFIYNLGGSLVPV